MHLIEDKQVDFVIADKGYDAQTIVDAIESKGRSLLPRPAFFEKHHEDMIAIGTKKEMRLNEYSIGSNNLDEFQLDTIN